VSNDIFFYKVGEAVGVDGLADWALRYGLAKNTGVDLPGEASGLFPTKDWREKFARDWYLGDTYHLAIGQGDLLVTPLQVSRWTSAIANGGKLCQPHVRQSNDQSSIINDQCQSMGISRKTVDLIKQGMVEACSPGGTGYPLFNFEIRNSKNTDCVQDGDGGVWGSAGSNSCLVDSLCSSRGSDDCRDSSG